MPPSHLPAELFLAATLRSLGPRSLIGTFHGDWCLRCRKLIIQMGCGVWHGNPELLHTEIIRNPTGSSLLFHSHPFLKGFLQSTKKRQKVTNLFVELASAPLPFLACCSSTEAPLVARQLNWRVPPLQLLTPRYADGDPSIRNIGSLLSACAPDICKGSLKNVESVWQWRRVRGNVAWPGYMATDQCSSHGCAVGPRWPGCQEHIWSFLIS